MFYKMPKYMKIEREKKSLVLWPVMLNTHLWQRLAIHLSGFPTDNTHLGSVHTMFLCTFLTLSSRVSQAFLTPKRGRDVVCTLPNSFLLDRLSLDRQSKNVLNLSQWLMLFDKSVTSLVFQLAYFAPMPEFRGTLLHFRPCPLPFGSHAHFHIGHTPLLNEIQKCLKQIIKCVLHLCSGLVQHKKQLKLHRSTTTVGLRLIISSKAATISWVMGKPLYCLSSHNILRTTFKDPNGPHFHVINLQFLHLHLSMQSTVFRIVLHIVTLPP